MEVAKSFIKKQREETKKKNKKGLLGELYFLENFLFPIFNKKISYKIGMAQQVHLRILNFQNFKLKLNQKDRVQNLQSKFPLRIN